MDTRTSNGDRDQHHDRRMQVRRECQAERSQLMQTPRAARMVDGDLSDVAASLLETTQEGVWIVDPAGTTRYANRRFAEMLGYEPDELFGVSAFDFFRASDHSMIREQLARRRRGEVATQEYRFTRRDGSDLWTITAASPICDATGTVVGSLGMVTDITKRKAMEDRLAISAAEYQSLAEATPQIVWSAEPDGAFDYVNGRWTEYTGISRSHARRWGWIPAVHSDDISGLLVAWRTALDGGSELEASVRLRRGTDSGGYRWHVMRARPLSGADGKIARWFGTLTDIHNERRTARQLEIIARTSTVLAESLDRDALLRRLADLVCEELAEFVVIVLIDEERHIRTVATSHRDPAAAEAMGELHGRLLLLPEFEAAAFARISRGDTYAGRRTPNASPPYCCRKTPPPSNAPGRASSSPRPCRHAAEPSAQSSRTRRAAPHFVKTKSAFYPTSPRGRQSRLRTPSCTRANTASRQRCSKRCCPPGYLRSPA